MQDTLGTVVYKLDTRFILAGRHGESKLRSCLSSSAIMQADSSARANDVLVQCTTGGIHVVG